MNVIFGRPPAMPEPDDPPPFPSLLVTETDEQERVRAWRTAHLEKKGLPYPLAMELALSGVDWHQVARAIDRGMTVKEVEEVFL